MKKLGNWFRTKCSPIRKLFYFASRLASTKRKNLPVGVKAQSKNIRFKHTFSSTYWINTILELVINYVPNWMCEITLAFKYSNLSGFECNLSKRWGCVPVASQSQETRQ